MSIFLADTSRAVPARGLDFLIDIFKGPISLLFQYSLKVLMASFLIRPGYKKGF